MKMKSVIVSGSVVAGCMIVAASVAGQEDASTGRASRSGERAARREAGREKAEERLQAAKERRETAKEKIRASKEDLSDAVSARVDKRQDNQSKRIQHGIKKGYLTATEVAKLNSQQQSIAALEASFKSDGRLSASEFKQLRGELNEASRCIWAEKHDTDGNQMPVYRLDRNVFAKNDLTAKLADESLTKEQARALLKDFRRTVELKRLLSGDLSEADRARMQAEYDELLNRYFEVR